MDMRFLRGNPQAPKGHAILLREAPTTQGSFIAHIV